ncbi:PAS domain S-box protein [Derxia lacustris]|uniref:PAS domain S-box protein n=1 Tax=Derxia lacustris TaxID=764842 RepID=UPI000A176254|nr:PAS domain S-box protein [Derxia lacustris]
MRAASPPPLARLARLTPGRFNLAIAAVVAVTLLLIGLYWSLLETSSQRLRAAALAQTEAGAQRLANAIAGQLGATLGGVDFALGFLRDRTLANRREFAAAASVVGAMFPPGAIHQIGVIDARGRLLYTTLPDAPMVDLADREYFRVHLDPGHDAMFMSAPIRGRATGQWSIQFSRPWRRDGQLAGVLVLSVSPRFLSARMAELGLDGDGSAGLIRDDGAFMARSVDLDAVLGQTLPPDRPYLLPGAPAGGVYAGPSTVDPDRRIFAWRRLDGLPLTAVVALSESSALALADAATQRARGSALAGSGLTLVLLVVVVTLLLSMRTQQLRLAESEASYRNLFEKNRSVKLLIDPVDGAIVAANPAAAEFYGYPRATLETMNIAALNPLTPEAMARELDAARRERRNHLRLVHRLASGRTREVEVYSGALEMHGRPLLYAIVHDVTERMRLETLLRAGEARYRALFDAVPEGLVMFDSAGGVLAGNRAAPLLLGCDEARLAAGEFSLLDADGQPLPPEAQPARRIADPRYEGGVYRAALPAGRSRLVALRRRPLPLDAGGEPLGALLTIVDLGELAAWRERGAQAGRGADAA